MGRRVSKKYKIGVGLSDTVADVASNPLGFAHLVNCYVDDTLGALVRRGGSETEVISGSLGIPLGAATLRTPDPANTFPVQIKTLVNFAGANFRQYSNGAWSTVTKTSNTNFSTVRPMTSGQIGSHVYLASGVPAVYKGSGDIERVGIPAPTTAPTLASVAGPLTGTFSYMYTFYDDATGLESDWSPLAQITVTTDQINLSGLQTTVAHSGVTHKRIYRTLNGPGSEYFFVAQVTLATTTYADTTSDNLLVLESAAQFDNALPPTTSFITCAFNKRMWWVNASDPWTIHYSKPYIGNNNDLQYYPASNRLETDEPVTALIWTPNRMLAMHPRGVSVISGFSDIDFQYSPLHEHKGTLFSTGAASDGTNLVWVSEEGIMLRSGEGTRRISLPIQKLIDGYLKVDYASSVYVWVIWVPYLRQFLFSLNGESVSGSPWINTGVGSLAEWKDSSSGSTETWEDAGAPGTEQFARSIFLGYAPETGNWTTYKIAQVDDLNEDGAYGTFLHSVQPSSDMLAIQENYVFMGFFDGTNGHVIRTHDPESGQDDGMGFDTEWLTGRIAPLEDTNNFMRLEHVQFSNAETDPSTTGTLQYLRDFESPQTTSFQTSLENFTRTGDNHKPENPKMRWLHLYGLDSDNSAKKVLLTDFTLNIREQLGRSGR